MFSPYASDLYCVRVAVCAENVSKNNWGKWGEHEWEGSSGNSTWESQANSLIAPWKRRLLIVR